MDTNLCNTGIDEPKGIRLQHISGVLGLVLAAAAYLCLQAWENNRAPVTPRTNIVGTSRQAGDRPSSRTGPAIHSGLATNTSDRVVYFLTDSERITEDSAALTAWYSMNDAHSIPYFYFLAATTPQQETTALKLIQDAAAAGQQHGVRVHLFDLRGEEAFASTQERLLTMFNSTPIATTQHVYYLVSSEAEVARVEWAERVRADEQALLNLFEPGRTFHVVMASTEEQEREALRVINDNTRDAQGVVVRFIDVRGR